MAATTQVRLLVWTFFVFFPYNAELILVRLVVHSGQPFHNVARHVEKRCFPSRRVECCQGRSFQTLGVGVGLFCKCVLKFRTKLQDRCASVRHHSGDSAVGSA